MKRVIAAVILAGSVLAGDRLGIPESMLIGVHTAHTQGIYNPATLRRLRELTELLARDLGAANVLSLASEKSDRLRPDALEFFDLLDPLPATGEELARLRGDVEALALPIGTLVSRDGSAAAIVLRVPAGADRVAYYRAIQRAVAAVAGPDEISIVEAPATRRRFEAAFVGSRVLAISVETPGGVIRGTLRPEEIGDREVRLPEHAARVDDLRDASITIRRRPTTPADGRPFQPVSASWSSWIRSVRRDPGSLVVGTLPRSGSPRFGLQPAPGEVLSYEIERRGLLVPEVLRRVRRFEEFLAGYDGRFVGGVLGPTDYLATTKFLIDQREPGSRRIPDSPEEAAWLWQMHEQFRGVARARQVVDEGYTRGVITAFVREGDAESTARLLHAIREYEARHLAPHGVRLTLVGEGRH